MDTNVLITVIYSRVCLWNGFSDGILNCSQIVASDAEEAIIAITNRTSFLEELLLCYMYRQFWLVVETHWIFMWNEIFSMSWPTILSYPHWYLSFSVCPLYLSIGKNYVQRNVQKNTRGIFFFFFFFNFIRPHSLVILCW